MKKRIFTFIVAIVFVLILAPIQSISAESIGKIDSFENVQDDGRYMSDLYRDNYSLDIEDTNLFESGDAAVNNIANALFSVVKTLGYLTSSLFYFAQDFNVADLFSPEIEGIQSALKSSIFDTLFFLAFAGAAFVLFKKLWKRDMNGLVLDIGKILLIVVLSTLVVTSSATALSGATSITKDVCTTALLDISNGQGEDGNTYATNCSGVIWRTLVHQPWISLQFNDTEPTADDVQNFLTTTPGSDARNDYIDAYIEAHPNSNVFDKSLGIQRIGFLIVYLIPFFIKCLIFILVACLQLAFQAIAVLYVLLAPVVLLLALMPNFGEMELVTSWLKKILETQVMILIITFIMGVIIKLDSLLYAKSSSYGWLIVITIETIVSLYIVFNYKTIIKGIAKIGNTAQQPQILKTQLQRSGNLMGAIDNRINHTASTATIADRRDVLNKQYVEAATKTSVKRPMSTPELQAAADAKEKSASIFTPLNYHGEDGKTVKRPTTQRPKTIAPIITPIIASTTSAEPTESPVKHPVTVPATAPQTASAEPTLQKPKRPTTKMSDVKTSSKPEQHITVAEQRRRQYAAEQAEKARQRILGNTSDFPINRSVTTSTDTGEAKNHVKRPKMSSPIDTDEEESITTININISAEPTETPINRPLTVLTKQTN